MKNLLCAVMLTSPLLYSTAVFADDAQQLRNTLVNTASLKADFKQTVIDVNKKVIQTGSGILALAHPNQFYWHLTSPDESQIVADGKDLWIYNPFAEEVVIMDFAEAINASPIALLVHRDDTTWSQYSVTKKQDCYDIRPKAIDSGIVTVSVCFKNSQLTKFNVLDDKGNLSQFDLSNQKVITTEDKALFKFVLPENVDIDDQRLKTLN
ncbi:outer membrane lipoprotein chaperone LolA [Shewanella putrefaciens]|jgi:outer membrane lipoprotein carrier protein|uniref:Outer-membrane lipoprotein carrier protein n=1 Tax=Shewanella putrefaciens (strain 200) TaxID=399804 RepID=E6XLC7_SHEP2|nr:outer membrane lipoprotein chaperone LolA [Shewanella putrefaciens]UXK10472.1 outer membrane lipoprotein chaperone LolA [Shewanella putrefaciens]